MPRARSSLAFLLAVACLSSATSIRPARASGDTFYVAPWGSDGKRSEGTAAAPWGSLGSAFRRLRPGDTLVVRGGVYRESVGWGITPGTREAPIRVLGAPGERAVLKGTLQLVGADYWVVSRLNVTRDPDKPISQFLVKFDGGIGWQFLSSEVWGTKGVSNVMVNSTTPGEPRGYRIAYNCIHDNDAVGHPFMNDHNIYLYPGYRSGPGVIERNILFNSENGNSIKVAGPNASTGAAYVTIRYNTMASAGQGMVLAYGSHHVSMYRNLIGPRRGGSTWYPAIRGYQLTGSSNVASANAAWGFARSLLSTSSTIAIRNGGGNVFVSPKFDSISRCSGFHPTNTVAKRYGRFAP